MAILAWAILGAIGLSAGISFLATPLAARVAVRFGMLDVPGRHKRHARAVPLLGGCAIFVAILGPSLLALALARVWSATEAPSWLPKVLADQVGGAAHRAMQALGILAAAAALHVVGIIDDRRGLGPWWKLLAQIAVAAFTVTVCEVRVLTAAGPFVSFIVSLLWLVAITNAFNFMDNMDGLAASVAAICAAALLGASLSVGQLFVPAWLCLLLGALLGFLPHNFPPAKIFMGDAGSMVIGYLLAVMSCLTTYVHPGQTYYFYGVFVPLVLMAIPLYDMVSVIWLRIRGRRNPMVGDRRHFSHRLLRRGLSVRGALLTICLCTSATAIAATLLPRVDAAGGVMIFAQTIAILLVLAMLESGDAKP